MYVLIREFYSANLVVTSEIYIDHITLWCSDSCPELSSECWVLWLKNIGKFSDNMPRQGFWLLPLGAWYLCRCKMLLVNVEATFTVEGVCILALYFFGYLLFMRESLHAYVIHWWWYLPWFFRLVNCKFSALDSDDLLYLKEQIEAEEDAERLLRRTEKRAFAAFKISLFMGHMCANICDKNHCLNESKISCLYFS